jgi:uncharacterized protein YbjT (DUF2867 family)
MSIHALILGATGATGKDLLKLLLDDDEFTQVDIFVRRTVDIKHDKLKVHLIDFDKPEEWKQFVNGDVLFSCLGTTLKTAGSKSAQWKIDYDYQYAFAQAARDNGVPNYILVSAAFASPGSLFFYAKMKGQLETAVTALGFPGLTIFNPPTLIRKGTDRPGELSGIKMISFLNKIGLFRSQKPMPTEVLAKAMIKAAKDRQVGLYKFKPAEIWQKAI